MSEAAAHLSHNHLHAGEPPKMGRFERVAGRFGVPVAILLAAGIGLWSVASWASHEWEWAKTNVFMPAVTKHLEFVGAVQKQGDDTAKGLSLVAAGLERLEKTITDNGDETHKLIREQTERMGPLAEKVASVAKPDKTDRPDAPPMPEETPN